MTKKQNKEQQRNHVNTKYLKYLVFLRVKNILQYQMDYGIQKKRQLYNKERGGDTNGQNRDGPCLSKRHTFKLNC